MKTILFTHLLTPLHAGSGKGKGIIDNAIQREPSGLHINYSLKGAFRSHFRDIGMLKQENDTKKMQATFGYDADEVNFSGYKIDVKNSSQKGAISIPEARTLLFCMASVNGGFAWVTCPAVLADFEMSLKMVDSENDFAIPSNIPCVTQSSSLSINKEVVIEQKVKIKKDFILLHDIWPIKVAKTEECDKLATWIADNIFSEKMDYLKDIFKTNFAVISNNDFFYYVDKCTDVRTGIKMDPKTGVVIDGALFVTEYLNKWSVMWLSVGCNNEFRDEGVKAKVINDFFIKNIKANPYLQAGGDAGIGMGNLYVTVLENKADSNKETSKK